MLVAPRRVGELASVDLRRVKNDLLDRLRSVKPPQEHLLEHWEQLDDIAKSKLATQIDEVDFDLLTSHYAGSQSSVVASTDLYPPAVMGLADQWQNQTAIELGERSLRDGRVGVALVAGGMGTRLGFAHPKGMFPIGPVSGNTIFQVLLERIVATGRRYGVRIPLYLMTSDATHQATLQFLKDHDGFGLPAEDLLVFCQGTLPAIDRVTGRLLMSGLGELATCPDGHGGFVEAIRRSGGLENMNRRGIDVLFYGQIDNPLLPIADPATIGKHLLADADITANVVKRASLSEKVGLFVSNGRKTWVMEYSELPAEIATALDDNSLPRFWAGNTAIHVFRVPFLTKIAGRNALEAHPCLKKVDYIDSAGQLQIPVEPNAIKFERFIFDLMHHTDRIILVESDRSIAFAPVKNPDSMTSDNPRNARATMVALHADWLRQAGTIVEPGVDVEISPLFALDANELRAKSLPGLVRKPMFFA